MTRSHDGILTSFITFQGYIGLDHKVIDMRAFYSALVQALKDVQRL